MRSEAIGSARSAAPLKGVQGGSATPGNIFDEHLILGNLVAREQAMIAAVE
jgi:hypothetical protein